MSQETQPDRKFGTFGGVFTPCTLTILGVIMFLRFGQVVGQAGVIYALVIVAVSKLITTLTALSLSAIATNTRVKGGGAYYLISRSLGVEFGGAIGVVFYLAQAISVSMYVIGFAEALVGTFPAWSDHFILIASIVNLATFACVYIGASWATKLQYFILATLVAALGSFYVGAWSHLDMELLSANLAPDFSENQSLFTVFALFFPAVTGIMAGANMSGDLRDASRSIPRGTLAAVVVTGLVYASQAVLLGCASPRGDLLNNTLVIKQLAAWPVLVTAGVLAATLSSALGSMMGAPRILQAFAKDDIFRSLKFLGAGSGTSREPRRATVLTFFIAQACILPGDLNAIAPIITMFFMITYGLLNLATFLEAVTRNPSYRPTFRYCHWSVSLLGAIGCLAVMFLMNWVWAAASIVVIAGLHHFIRYREIEARWGDLRSGVVFERARQSLLKLEQEAYHPKNWRPVVLALSGTAWNRPHLAIYGHWLTAGHGILSLAHVVTGDIEQHAERRDQFEKTLRGFIDREELQAFPAVVVSQYLSDGVEALVQCHGIGDLRPNTVLLGWPNDPQKAESFGATVRLVSRLGRSIVALRFLEYRDDSDPSEESAVDHDAWVTPSGTIDVWWRGKKNGSLMLLLGHLLHQNPEWRTKRIRVLRAVPNEAAREDVTRHVQQLSVSARISTDAMVVVTDDAAAAIQAYSADAAIVIFGFESPGEGNEAEFFERMEQFAGRLPRVLFVESAGGMELDS